MPSARIASLHRSKVQTSAASSPGIPCCPNWQSRNRQFLAETDALKAYIPLVHHSNRQLSAGRRKLEFQRFPKAMSRKRKRVNLTWELIAEVPTMNPWAALSVPFLGDLIVEPAMVDAPLRFRMRFHPRFLGFPRQVTLLCGSISPLPIARTVFSCNVQMPVTLRITWVPEAFPISASTRGAW